MTGTIIEKLRWRLVVLLDRSPRFCWADLVVWAQTPSRENRITAVRGANWCCQRSLEGSDRSCYCGKFAEGRIRPEVKS